MAIMADETDDFLDDGPGRPPRAPGMRRCIATGRPAARDGLIRFVVDPDGRIVPDLAAKLPGRGMWLSADRQRFKTALDKKLFARAARRPVTVDPDLADRVAALLARRLIDLVGLARRGGEAVAGFEKTRAALAGGRAALLLEAVDGARAPREKLARLAPGAPRLACLTAAELGRAFARDRAVHAAIAPGGLARRIETEGSRLAALRPVED